MVQIDRLPRISISTLKPLFKKAQELLSEEKYRGRGLWVGQKLHHNEREILVKYYPEEMRLLLNWEYDGKKREQPVELMEVESNLGLNSYLCFVCPYSGKRSRKLYTDWRVWSGRGGFRHTYSGRNESKRFRGLCSASAAIRKLEEEDGKKYVKNFYNGNPTPTFKREMKLIRKAKKFKAAYIAANRKSNPNFIPKGWEKE